MKGAIRNRKLNITLGGLTAIIAATLLYLGASLPLTRAHIVPPEELHPVVEAYRRLTFLLNLNPVLWEKVKGDFDTLVRYSRPLDTNASSRAEKELDAALSGLGLAMVNDAEPPAEPARAREEARRRVFELATRTLARLIVIQLEQASKVARDRRVASQHLSEARQLLAAFEKTLYYSDPEGFRRLGQSWLAMSGALGSGGILRVGAIQEDPSTFSREAENITAYLIENYADTFRAPPGRVLAPLPQSSPTFRPNARLPQLLPPRANINKQNPRPRQILNMAARGVDERETFLIALGDMAFDSSFVFGEPARSLGITCNTCHNKGVTNPEFFIPGLSHHPGSVDVSNSFFDAHANNGVFDPLDIPDLRGIRFTAPYGRNGRFASLREFVRNVLVNEFNGPEPDPDLLDSLVAYMLEFDYLPNPYLNSDGSLNPTASEAAQGGEEIFHRTFPSMKNRSCASCHVSGTFFLDRQRHDVGTVPPAEAYGKDGALDTPTLLGIRFTAPYFHDGSRPTLESVVNYFDDYYGLGLTRQERGDLTAYLETVGDGVRPFEEGESIVAPELEEFEIFLSTYETLVARRKPHLIQVLLQTLAFEVRAHKWDLKDPALEPVMEEMAQALDVGYAALEAGEMGRVEQAVAKYRTLYRRHKEELQ